MQYFTAFAIILSWTANRLQCSNPNTTIKIGPMAKLEVSPQPQEGSGRKEILRRRDEPLNLTCTSVHHRVETSDTPLLDYVVDWKLPRDRNLIHGTTRVEQGQGPNSAWVWFERLTEGDAGDYRCLAVATKFERLPSLYVNITLSVVKNRIDSCGSRRFQCHAGNCIMIRYVCDGMPDCKEGEDESYAAGCGPHPCVGKVFCGRRCLPPDWCCTLSNCNTTLYSTRQEPPVVIATDHQRFSDMGFLQTTIYTVIGCAMAFMFIVTILVIAICRVHMKRAMNSRCPQQLRNPGPRQRHSVPCHSVPLAQYDLDVYLNRAADLNHPGGVTVTYNINNGLQFVGRPVEPPPYSEIASVPPREGPPPPYVSRENLLDRPANQRIPSNLTSVVPLLVNTHISTIARSQNINESSTAITRITPGFQNSSNFTAGQIPGPQVRPGFNSFNHSSNSDAMSNTTFNISDSTALSTSSNSDSGSSSSVGNFAIGRNITSHSQNFEPEYTETDALLLDNAGNDSPAQNADRLSRKLDSSSRRSEEANLQLLDLAKQGCEVLGNGKKKHGLVSGNSENEGSAMESASKTTSDGQTTLPFFLNVEREFKEFDIDSSCSDAVLEEASSSLVIIDRDLVKVNSYDLEAKSVADLAHHVFECKKGDKVSSANKAQKCLGKKGARNREDLADSEGDSPIFEKRKCSVSYEESKEEKLAVPSGSVGDSPVSYGNLSSNFTANDISEGDTETVDSEQNTPSREAQPLVMPLRESFIGVRKES